MAEDRKIPIMPEVPEGLKDFMANRPKITAEQRADMMKRVAAMQRTTPAVTEETQEIKTPLIEQDVELSPESVGPNKVTKTVRRVWASLWGQSPAGPKRIRCDRNGDFYAPRVDFSDMVSYEVTHDVDNSAEVEFDFGVVCDYVHITTSNYLTRVKFSLDGIDKRNRRLLAPTASGLGLTGISFGIFTRCRYVHAIAITGAIPQPVYMTGEKFNS